MATTSDIPAGLLEQVSRVLISATSVQLPTFIKDDPEAWFSSIEAHFALKNISDPKTKFYHAVAKLDAETTSAVREVIRGPATDDSYQALRNHLCDLFQAPPEQRLDELFAITTIGDMKPTRFARELDRLAEGQTMEDVKTRIFLRSLPPSIRTAISGSVSRSYADLVKAAEKAWARADESNRTAVNRIDHFSVSTVSSRGAARSCGRGGRFLTNPNPRPLTETSTRPLTAQNAGRFPDGLCRYHRRWGDNARSCTQSCTRWPGRRAQAQPQPHVFAVEEEEEGVSSENS